MVLLKLLLAALASPPAAIEMPSTLPKGSKRDMKAEKNAIFEVFRYKTSPFRHENSSFQLLFELLSPEVDVSP